MAKISKDNVMRVDEVEWEDWKKAEKLLLERNIWFTTSDNEAGYNLVDTVGGFAYEVLIETGILTKEQKMKCIEEGIETLLLIFR